MKAYLILLFCTIFVLSSAIAEPDYYYKKGELIDLKIPCVNDGRACNSSAQCNISISYPNSTSFVDNAAMTNRQAYLNYTVPSLNIMGDYSCNVYCYDGAYGFESFVFNISDNGQKSNDYTFIIAIAVVAAFILALGFMMNIEIYSGPFKVLSILFSILLVLLIPAYFTTFNVALSFWFLFIGYVIVASIILSLYGIHTLLINTGIVRGFNDKR